MEIATERAVDLNRLLARVPKHTSPAIGSVTLDVGMDRVLEQLHPGCAASALRSICDMKHYRLQTL